MTEREIIEALSKTDPVYGPVAGLRLENGRISSIRICALCRRRSGHNQENVTHTLTCPWIPAKDFMRETKKLPGPGLGFLEVGILNGEVVVNHPDLKPDENGVGHIVFSPDQAQWAHRASFSRIRLS